MLRAKLSWGLIAALVGAAVISSSSLAYVLNGYTWPFGTVITMQLALGGLPRGLVLEDGSGSWSASAADALSSWNQHLALVRFNWVADSNVAPRPGDHANSVGFAGTIFGQSFGASTLAVTIPYTDSSNHFTETDTIFNNTWEWNSYRGPLQFDHSGKLIADFHRVALHEFGHTLGLGHPDEAGQSVVAIMNSQISDVDALTSDDIAGVLYLYGLHIISALNPPAVWTGLPFQYQIQANFSATTFSSSALPAGLQLDGASGLISGTPAQAGNFSITIYASGVRGTASATLHLTLNAPQITSSLAATTAVGQWFNYWITANNSPTNFSASGLPPGLTLAATNGLIMGTPTQAGNYSVTISASSATTTASANLQITIYAGVLTGSTSPITSIGRPFSLRITASNHPTSFELTSPLPNGVTFDSATGIISGNFVLSGTYNFNVIAHGPLGDAVGQVSVTVEPDFSIAQPAAVGALRSWPIQANHLVYDPARAVVYASDYYDGAVVVVDSQTLTVVDWIFLKNPPTDISLSPDGSKLWYVAPSPGWMGSIDLNTRTEVSGVSTGPYVGVQAVPNGNLYVSDSADFWHIDPTTGRLLGSYLAGGMLALSPDGHTLFAGPYGLMSLYSYDVSQANPVLTNQVSSSLLNADGAYDVKLSHDGHYLCLPTRQGNNPSTGSVVTALIPTANIGSVAGYFINGAPAGNGAFSNDDTIFYQGAGSNYSAVQMFDVASFAEVGSIPLGGDGNSAPMAKDMVVDGTDSRLFVATEFVACQNDLRVYSTGRGTAPAATPTAEKILSNISTRGQCLTGASNLVAGFIIHGSSTKRVAIRAIGPSLGRYDVEGWMADPMLTLFDSTGQVIATNDNWNSNRFAILAAGMPPADEHEAVILADLSPGAYTVGLQGVANTTGVALVEVYDLAPSTGSIANLSTRGHVATGDNVLIGGFVVGGDQPTRLVVRALGPTLTTYAVPGALADPTLEIHNGSGTLISFNDDWKSAQQATLQSSGYAPPYDRESAIIGAFEPGNYTAIVRGKNNSSGVALVEVYNLDAN